MLYICYVNKTLGASGGQHSDGKRLKANGGNDYQEVVTRKLTVPNPFAKAENLCLTQRRSRKPRVKWRQNKYFYYDSICSTKRELCLCVRRKR